MAEFKRSPTESRERFKNRVFPEYAEQPRRTVRYQNVRPVLGLSGGTHILSVGKVWEVPPVPWELGVKLMEIRQGLERIQAEDPEGSDPAMVDLYRRLLEEAVALFPKLLKPVKRKLFWRFRRNPWRAASEREIGEVLAFVYGCRTRSPGRRQQVMGDRRN